MKIKRFMSVMLAVSIVVAMGVVPMTASAAAPSGYPYVWADFEGNDMGGWSTNSPSGMSGTGIVEDGFDGGESLKVNITGSSACWMKKTFSVPFSFGTYKVGMWVKNTNITTKDDGSVVVKFRASRYNSSDEKLYDKGIELTKSTTVASRNGWDYYSWTGNIASTGWNAKNATGDDAYWNLYFWVGSTEGGKNSTATTAEYFVDEIEFVKVPTAETVATDKNAVKLNQFDGTDGKTNFRSDWADMTIVDNTGATVSTTDSNTSTNDTNIYAKIVANSTGTGAYQKTLNHFSYALEYGHVYHISYKFKVENVSKYNDETVYDTATAWFMMEGAKGADSTTALNAQGKALPTVGGDWVIVDYYIAYNDSTKAPGATVNTSAWMLRISPGNSKDNGGTIGTFYIDDLKIEDMGSMANGEIEATDSSVFAMPNNNGKNADSDAIVGWSSSQTSNTNNATKTLVADPRPGSTGSKAMKVNVTTAGGYVYRGADLENGKAYTMTFWAKGTAGQTMTVTHGTDTKNFALTADWAKYTMPMTGAATLSYIKFEVNGNAADTEYYLDDVVLYEGGLNPQATPEGIDVVNQADGDYAGDYLKAQFATDIATADDKSFVKVYAVDKTTGAKSVIASKADNNMIEIPASAVGKSLEFYIVPCDASGNIGAEVAIASPTDYQLTKVRKKDGVGAEVYSFLNGYADTTIIFAAYDASGMLLDCELVTDRDLTAQTWNEISTPAGFDTTGAAKTRVMVWQSIDGIKPITASAEWTN